MSGAAKATTNHERIRAWAEARGGKPAAVKGTGAGNDPGILRIDFPGFGTEASLEHISWERFFKAFEQNELAFLYQDTIDGNASRFNKLVARNTVQDQIE